LPNEEFLTDIDIGNEEENRNFLGPYLSIPHSLRSPPEKLGYVDNSQKEKKKIMDLTILKKIS
jgi:hypothetical protein